MTNYFILCFIGNEEVCVIETDDCRTAYYAARCWHRAEGLSAYVCSRKSRAILAQIVGTSWPDPMTFYRHYNYWMDRPES